MVDKKSVEQLATPWWEDCGIISADGNERHFEYQQLQAVRAYMQLL